MLRKLYLLAAALLMTALLASTPAVGAQVPKAQGDKGDQPPKGLLVEGVDVAQADEKNPSSAALRSAISLRSSLTPEQQQAIRSILKQHEADMAAAVKQFPPLRELPALSNDPEALKAGAAEDAANFQAIQQSGLHLKALQDRMDAKIGAVLTAEQRKLYQAAIALQPIEAAKNGEQLAASSATSSYNPNYNVSYCSAANTNASVADYYSYFARLNAYYNYIYNTYGSYAAYSYLNTADTYATSGQYQAASVYFDEYTIHADPFGRAARARSYLATSTNNAYYGYQAAYTNWHTYRYTYAYNAYYYGYWTNYYAYRGYYYAYYC